MRTILLLLLLLCCPVWGDGGVWDRPTNWHNDTSLLETGYHVQCRNRRCQQVYIENLPFCPCCDCHWPNPEHPMNRIERPKASTGVRR